MVIRGRASWRASDKRRGQEKGRRQGPRAFMRACLRTTNSAPPTKTNQQLRPSRPHGPSLHVSASRSKPLASNGLHFGSLGNLIVLP